MANLDFYTKLAHVPDEAKKSIEAGRLKGMTSISPMWRIKVMTETFGPCGVGWKIEYDEPQVIDYELSGEKLVFVKAAVCIKDKDTWSTPIFGFGTSKLVAKERNGMYFDEEAFKKAQTDAFGSAVKYLGVGGEVYFEEDNNDTPSGEPTVYLKYPVVGKKLADDEIIKKEQALHLADCILQEGKKLDAIVGYLNTRPQRSENKLDVSDANVLENLTYEEYETILYMFSGFKRT